MGTATVIRTANLPPRVRTSSAVDCLGCQRPRVEACPENWSQGVFPRVSSQPRMPADRRTDSSSEGAQRYTWSQQSRVPLKLRSSRSKPAATTLPSPSRKTVMSPRITGPYARDLREFIAFKRTRGCLYGPRVEHRLLSFDRFVAANSSGRRPALKRLIGKWLSRSGQRDRKTVMADLSTIRQFCLFLRRRVPNCHIPDLGDGQPGSKCGSSAPTSTRSTRSSACSITPGHSGPDFERARFRR